MMFDTDIDSYIENRYGQDADTVLGLFEEHIKKYPDHNGRIIRCILFLADGSMDEILNMLEVASKDYRDVIYWAEYTDLTSKEPRRIRNFNMAFGNENI